MSTLTDPVYQSYTVLLTGATGFLGSHLLKGLLSEGYNIVILKRSTSNTWRIANLLNSVTIYDIDSVPITKCFESQRIDAVIHTACHYGRNGDTNDKVVEANLMFGLKVLETASLFNTKTFLNTDTLLPKHIDAYTLSKKQFSEWLCKHCDKIQIINLKPEHIYGPFGTTTNFVHWILSQFEQRAERISLTKGDQLRDFIYVDDVVSAYLKTLQKAKDMPVFSEFDIGTGILTSVRTFVETLKVVYDQQRSHSKTQLDFGKVPYRKGELMRADVDNSSLLRLAWQPKFDINAGLKKTIELEFKKQ